MKLKAILIALLLSPLFPLAGFSPAQTKHAASPPFIVREQRTVIVDGAKEEWQLLWLAQPKSICGVKDIEAAISCPCSGFAYGEQGKLVLVRSRAGTKIEQMDMRQVFDIAVSSDQDMDTPGEEPGMSYLQRWPFYLRDFNRKNLADAAIDAEIEKRAPVEILRFADYNHDGHGAKFLLHVGNVPCGKEQYVAVGVTADEPHLHVLSSAEFPDRPLVMLLSEWQALLSGPGPHTVLTWPCGDHGSEVYSDAVVSSRKGKIYVKDRTFECLSNDKPGRLIRQTER